MNHITQNKIENLRSKSLFSSMNAISVFIGAVIANMIAPQLLLKYVYDANTLTEAPPIFEYLPLVTYSLAMVYFVFAVVTNYMRERKISLLEKELSIASMPGCCGGDCCNGDDSCCSNEDAMVSEAELAELEKIVDEALQPKKESVVAQVKKTENTDASNKKKKHAKKK